MADKFYSSQDKNFLVYGYILQWNDTDLPAGTTQGLSVNSQFLVLLSTFAPRDGKFTRLVYQIGDDDTGYSNWTTGTLQFRVDINGSAAYTSTAYTKTTYNNDRVGTNSACVVDDVDISFSEDDEIEVFAITDGSWNSSGAEVCVTTFGLLEQV